MSEFPLEPDGTHEPARSAVGDAVASTPRDEDVVEHRSTRARRGRGRARITLNLTAMIDVVFLLLIYFMVATNFRIGEEVYRLDLPQNLQSQAERDPFQLDEQPLRIQVLSTGPGRFQYRLGIDGPFAQPASFDELHRFLLDRQINADSPAGMFLPDHPIIIEPARTATWDHAVGAFNAAARARYTNIRFAEPK